MDLRGLDKEWRGFSDLDIKKVKSVSDPPKTTGYQRGGGSRGGGPPNRPPRPQHRQQVLIGDSNLESGDHIASGDAPPPSWETPPPSGHPATLEERKSRTRDGEQSTPGSDGESMTEMLLTKTISTSAELELRESPSDSQKALQLRRQQEMEEENKKKKELVEKRLKERYMLSQQESENLKRVQRELASLDQLVTRDIAVLRDKIEEANRHYNRSKVRYEIAEKEFVSAKLELHKSKEQKELLSEHLCAVIRETELRKSRKLSQLCQALGVSDITQ